MVDKKSKVSSSWICPNDRQLMLRAQLRIGWSVKAEQYEKFGNKPAPLTDSEREVIADVIKRAEALDNQEQERIGRLVERVDNMKKYALGSGAKECVLCGEKFRFLSPSSLLCHDCHKLVCSKCGIESTSTTKKNPIWLCKICAETREMWKKSGAWFYKSVPKYVIPKNTDQFPNNYRICHPDNMWTSITPRASISAHVNEESSSSEDELTLSRSKSPSAQCLPVSSPQNVVSPTSTVSKTSSRDKSSDTTSASALAPIMTNISINNVSDCSATSTPRSKYIPEHPFRQGSSESGSSRTQSTESSGFIPHIYVNHCDAESNVFTRDFSESDKASVSSGVSGQHGPDDLIPEEDVTASEMLAKGNNMGTIELSIQYDPDANSLHISLHRAKGLRGMNINGVADPFCKLNLLPVGAKSYRLRTRTIPKTVNPEFNETLTFYGITDKDISTQSLHILVLDDDKYGHDFLGEAKFPLCKLKPWVTRDLCLGLDKHIPASGEIEDEVWGEGTSCRGQIALTLLYSTRKRALIVGIVRCINLIPMDNNGYSDPFVKLWLKSPEGCTPKYKTSVKWKNLNPIYKEEFLFDTKITDLSRKSLVITVWDKDPGKTNDYLGCLELGCHSKGERLRHWIDMIKYPDHKHEGVHNLSEDLIR